MSKPIIISERFEFDYCINRGFNPLLDIINFKINIKLRVEIQKELFGHCILGITDIPKANQRFYYWVWKNKKHICEETMLPLLKYSSVYISHILTRGAHPEMAHDPRNTNILSFNSHNMWEIGKREQMRIFEKNKKIIELLKLEYNQL